MQCSGCSICLLENAQGLSNNLNPIKALLWDFSGASSLYTWATFTINNGPFGARFSTLIRKHFCYAPSGKLPGVSVVQPVLSLPRTAVALNHGYLDWVVISSKV